MQELDTKTLALSWRNANATADQLAKIIKFARETLQDPTVSIASIVVKNGVGITLD